MPYSQDVLARFWAKVDVRGPDECWPWLAGRVPAGYGKFKLDGKDVPAHRVAYEAVEGEIPEARILRHGCNNPPCCNPRHLTPGAHAQNQFDAVECRRRPPSLSGKHPRSKISAEDAAAIRPSSLPGTVLARQFGVAKSTIHFVRYGPSLAVRERWRVRREAVLSGA